MPTRQSRSIISFKLGILGMVLLLTDASFLLDTNCYGITTDELIQILHEQEQPRSGRLTFERHVNRLETPELLLRRNIDSSDGMRIVKANADKRYEDTLIFQVDKHRYNLIRTDLRDVQALMKENSIPEEARANVDLSSIQMLQDNYTGRYSAFANNVFLTDKGGSVANWSLDDQCRQGIFQADFLRQKFVGGSSLSEISVGTKNLVRLRIELNKVDDPTERAGEIEIDFDPAVGYRYLRYARFLPDGTLYHEILLSDYRDVNGYVMPFKVIENLYKANGTLRKRDEVQIKKAEFDDPVTDEDFAIAVPAGTSITCRVEGIGKHFRLEGRESLTIESIIAKAAARVADELAYDSLKDLEKGPLPDLKEPVADSNEVSDESKEVKAVEPEVDLNEPVRDESLLIAEQGIPGKRGHLLTIIVIASIVGIAIAVYMARYRAGRS